MAEPKVLYEDQHLIVIDKPAGLLSQGEHRGDPNVVDWLRERLGRPYVGLVHRLDRNTSGLMVVAKRSKAATRLTDALQAGKIDRSYLAWVIGRLEEPTRWSHRLLKDERQNKTRVVTTGGQTAALEATPVGSGRLAGTELTLVRFVLETGRSHQIRAQSAHEGYPLLGDVKYGGPGGPRFARPALHSAELRFPHPMDAEDAPLREFAAPLPEDLATLMIQPLR
jgi:23S rRNA pseudouridine1911/1915/1917 synthase